MELKFTAMTAQVTIESLVHLIKNSNINFDSINVVVTNTNGGFQSPEMPIKQLVKIVLGDMHEIISTDQQLDSLNLKSGEQTFKYGCRDLLLRSLHSSKILRTSQNWVHVKNMLGVGRTVSILICEELGVDPDGTKFVRTNKGEGNENAKS